MKVILSLPKLVYIKNLVPKDHILRQIDKYVDFSLSDKIPSHSTISQNKKPFKKEKIEKTKEIKVSSTDPDNDYMVRDGKPKEFFYLDHRTVDGKHNIVTDVYVTPDNVTDVSSYIERLDIQIKKFNFKTKYVGADAGYLTNNICRKIFEKSTWAALLPHAWN